MTEIDRTPPAARLGQVLAAMLAALGRPVFLNALALNVGLGIFAAILFSSNGGVLREAALT